MTYKDIILSLNIIETELNDAVLMLGPGSSESQLSIDCAMEEINDLRHRLESKVSREQKDHEELYNIK